MTYDYTSYLLLENSGSEFISEKMELERMYIESTSKLELKKNEVQVDSMSHGLVKILTIVEQLHDPIYKQNCK